MFNHFETCIELSKALNKIKIDFIQPTVSGNLMRQVREYIIKNLKILQNINPQNFAKLFKKNIYSIIFCCLTVF